MRSILRDPFARGNVVRRTSYSPGTCAWCGQVKTTRTGRPFLYRYGWASDGGRTEFQDKRFCSRSCERIYNQ